MRTPALYYYGLAAFCVVSLFIGMAHAADPTPAAINTTKIHGFGYGHPPMPQLNLSCLGQQGVTMTGIKEALERNDTASVRTWRDACGQSPKGVTGNANLQKQQKFRTGIAPLERNGTKVCPARNLSEHSTITGMTPGSFDCNITHKSPVVNSTIFRRGLLSNGTIMHHALNRADINQKTPAHLNGNTTAMKPFPDQNRRPYPGEMPGGPRSGPSTAVNAIQPGTQPTI